jgi:hypothetical protein
MHRRDFLRAVMTAGVAVVTTPLILPKISTALAEPERRFFLPPSNGWPKSSSVIFSKPAPGKAYTYDDWNAANWPTRTHVAYTDTFSRGSGSWAEIVRFDMTVNGDERIRPGDIVRCATYDGAFWLNIVRE